MLRLKVEAIKWETADTATFFLSNIAKKNISYTAGQFITLVFTHHDEEIRRSYSLSSSPREQLLSITVKRISNGEISRFMLTKVKVGDIINAVEPAGRFIITDFAAQKDVVLLAGGSGIVPVFSQLKYIMSGEGKSNLTLIYSSRDAKSVLFKTDLDLLATMHPGRLKIIYLLSSEGNRLNNILLEQLVKQNIRFDIANAEFYLCGPFSYMRMIRLTLLYMGLDAAQIRKENFVIETVPVIDGTVNYPPQAVQIIYDGEIHDIMVAENQSILQAALQNNILLPYSCKAGICSACMAKCTSGKVEMAVNDVLTDNDLALGWVLTCTGHPVGDRVTITSL